MYKKIIVISLALLATAGTADAQRKGKAASKKNTAKTVQKKQAPAKKQKAQPAPQKPAPAKALPRASRDTIKGATIEVYQNYKPELKPAPKPAFNPSLPPADTTHPSFRYEVPQQTLYYTYRSLPLRPLALGKDSAQLPYPSYVKLGGGNLNTIYLDAGIASLKGTNWESAIHLHHLSQKGSKKEQQTATSGAEAEGTLHAADHAFNARLEVLRRRVGYYGFTPDLAPGLEPDLKQIFTGLHFSVGARNERPNNAGIDYAPVVHAGAFGDRFDNAERSFGFDVPVTKQFDSTFRAGIGLSGRFVQFDNDVANVSNNIFQVKPFVEIQEGSFKGRLGLYPTIGKNSNTYLLPDISIGLRIPKTTFDFSAGWQALLQQNTYEELSLKNPFLTQLPTFRQTRSDQVYAGIGTNIGNHFALSGKVSWLQYRNLPLFLSGEANRTFDLIYDEKVQALCFQAGLRYQVGNAFAVGVNGTWYNFYEKSYSRVWHEPSVRLGADLMVRPLPELTVTAYGTVLDQMYALDDMGTEKKLKGILDIGGGAEYQIIPRLSIFANVHNLLNNKYERWRGYEAYGFNIFGGLRLKF